MKRFFPAACLAAVISLLLSAIWLTPAAAATMPTITPLGQIKLAAMTTPGAMDLDAAGNLYMADNNGKVFKFSRYGQLLSTFTLQATGRGLAVTPDGTRLYISRASDVVIVDAASGAILGSLADNPQTPEFVQAGEIDLDADGHVFVMDSSAQRMNISVYSAAGAYLTQFGGPGINPGQFGQMGGLVVNNVNQLVVTSRNMTNAKIVDVFTLDPATLAVTRIDTYNGNVAANFGPAGLVYPRGIAIDNQQRSYVFDYNETRLCVVDSAFGYLGVHADAARLAVGYDVAFDAGTSRLFASLGSGVIEIFGVDGGANPVNVNQAPTVPLLQSPVGGSQVATATPTLQFANATDSDGDAITYQVTVRQGGTTVYQTSVAAAAGASTTLAVPAGNLLENTVYSWTVQATDSQGASSAASAAGTFLVNAVDDPPATPALLAPLAGESLTGAGVLAWSAVVDPDPADTLIGYRVEAAADAAFAAIVLSAQTAATSIALQDFADYAGLAAGSAYFWRVTALDADLTASLPGAAGSFTYAPSTLLVTANMPGAKVYIGGNHGYPGAPVGTVPVELRDLPAGPLAVVVERAGFEPYVTQVQVGAAAANVYARLSPARRPAGHKLVPSGVNGSAGLTVGGGAAPFLVDFNSDGQLDLLVGDAAGQLRLYPTLAVSRLNQITVDAAQSLGLPVLPGAIPFVADWDNDGRQDLLVGLADGTVKLFLNSGAGFAAGVELQAAGAVLDCGTAAAPAVADLDGDGRKDLVLGNAAGQVAFYRNLGSDAAPQLAAPVALAQLAGAAVPASADWDGDGLRDLLVTAAGQSRVYLNTFAAKGALTDGGVVPLVSGFAAAFAMDVNGTYGKDLLVGRADGRVDYWTGNGGVLVSSYKQALLDKADELAALVAAEAPERLGAVTEIRTRLQGYNLPYSKKLSEQLAAQLAAGAARTSALELVGLCL